ncbi:uncharacterized protein EAF01_001684 [Botrytis porri]|uniref:Uncharacterized protein n=1 Tax=Botrytis porri TaxID=87229 RepID=A0A4Z1L372_9HELO|nr:uncharacterized protein EAF01_001684 [Botrytis porri]KAF7912663.1 hypothetical protein EAF01_001684 [Botrytis porri]TGO91282.1 hypothetical protein BPOR_0032g00020 [Botrytis porri]
MDPNNEPTEESLPSINLLQLNNTEEFPALSSNPKLSTQNSFATPPNWGSLFASQVSKRSQPINQSTLPPLPVTPTKEMTSPKDDSVDEKEIQVLSPNTAECMSVLSTETSETAVEAEDANTPWDSPTQNGEDDTPAMKEEEFENETAVPFPDFVATKTSSPSQREVPPFQFPAVAGKSESDIYSASPEPMKTKNTEVEELCEAERHDTPSYIRGGLPLWDVVVNDPHRVIHAIKHMMHGIVVMSKATGAPPQEIKTIMDSHLSTLRQIEILTERERVAKLALEMRQAADRGAQMALEKERAITVKEMEPSKPATKFNPGAKPFAPSKFVALDPRPPMPLFALAPATKNPPPLKYSVIQQPGFMVEQSRAQRTQVKFHPFLNRSRTWSTHRPSNISINTYSHFDAYNQKPPMPIFLQHAPSPSFMASSQLSSNSLSYSDIQQEEMIQDPPNSSTPVEDQDEADGNVDSLLADRPVLRIPVAGKTDHKSTPSSPTRQLSANTSLKATSTNTSPRRKVFNVQATFQQQQAYAQKVLLKNFIPATAAADDIKRVELQLPRTHRHICPSSLSSSDFQCPMPNCMLQRICPDFTSENGCSYRPPPLSDWPWNYPPREPPINQSQQCPYVHIPGTCLHSLSFFRIHSVSNAASNSTLDSAPYPTVSNHYCPVPKCTITRFHSWGCAKDWKTGFAVNGITPCAPNQDQPSLAEINTEWRWRVLMEGLRFAHERGQYGCQGGTMPVNASFPDGHQGADSRNWAPDSYTEKPKTEYKNAYMREKERGRARDGTRMGGSRGRGDRGGSSDKRREFAREKSTRSA